ncbi:MAG TPA: AMIN domain-containing protein, partial [Blastocatellia bacterium]|nr:AMIN domain-containing protein [Blastocatellia bacterium]
MIKAKYVSSTALSVLMGISMIAGLGSVTPGGTMASPLADKGGLNRATDGSAAGESGGKDGNGASSDASHKAGGQAFTLMSLKHETVGPLTRIVVESSAPPLYTVSRPNDRLIVIELPGGDGSKLAREYAIGTSTVDSIRVKGVGSPTASVASSAGSVQTRIEIGVKTGIKDRSSLTGNTLVLELSPEQAASAAGHLSSESAGPDSRHDNDGVSPSANRRVSDAVDVGVPNQGTAKAGVYVYPVSVRSSSKSDARPAEQAILKPATVIRRLRTEPGEAGLRIVLDADGQPEFKDFTLTDPARIVVDVIGVRSELENKAMAVDQGGIQRIRVGQPSSGVVRIVLDSKQKVAYRVVRNGDSLIIDIGNEAFKPAAVQEPADSSVKIDQSVKQDKAAQLQTSSAMLAVEPKRSSDAEKSAE